jgi:hypothetical protein
VIPTEHTAKPTVTSKIGRFATLRGLLQAQGSGALARSAVVSCVRVPGEGPPSGFLARRFVGLVAALALLALGGISTTAPAFAAEPCPNEARRVEQGSTYLGACRAYEVVSPAGTRPNSAQAAVGGGAVAWNSYFPPDDLAGQTGGQEYLARRAAGSWSTVGVTPPQSPEAALNLNCKPSMFFSPSLARGVLSDGQNSASLAGNGEEPCVAHNEPSLVSEPTGWQSEPEGFQNLFVADIGEEGPTAWRLVNRTRVGVAPADARLEDASTEEHDELSHIVFGENAQLTEEAPAGFDLYEWFNGEVHLVTFLPDGQPTVGTLVNGFEPAAVDATGGAAAFTNAVSADGSRVFFVSGGNLYVRLHAEREPQHGALGAAECVSGEHACTIQVDASQAGGPGGGGTFLTANTAGTKVFFIDSPAAQLTSDTEAGSGENLYEYEVATGRLIDLTGGEAHANVLGYSGFGERPDGSYDLYFVAEGALGATGATAGRPNLYVADESGGKPQTQYIAFNAEASRVSPDGELITFISTEAQAIAGYDNTPAQPAACEGGVYGSPSGLCHEVFVYEAGASKPTCVSCHWGSPPAGPSSLAVVEGAGTVQNRPGPGFLTRNVANDGSVFFDSPDALVSEDVNGVGDVYEYHEGHVHLISSGTSTEESTFADASADGTDVFFRTSQRLLSGDASDGTSMYDARREGGFIGGSGEAVEGQLCESAEACKPPPGEPPAEPFPASSAFSGPGNLVSPPPPPPAVVKPKPTKKTIKCKKHFVKNKKGKCVKKKSKKKAKRAGRNRRTK